ncbi:hypothetical protein PV328_006631 [Microctonus aethiopoides]|uniref:Uncharacterized protein n=1 Tax=Microctonus aethiopoides TaxID=144406 RepID=A0AA39FQ50_9HYME|nr:hypothetical protein PV328_006631 [Microctonus aethiopoides]
MNVYRMMFSLMFIVLFISLNLENVKAINWKAVDLLWKRPRRAVTEKIPKYSEDCATGTSLNNNYKCEIEKSINDNNMPLSLSE